MARIDESVGGLITGVLLGVGIVDPLQRLHKELVHGGCDVAHKCHKEQRDLQDVFLEETKAVGQGIIPSNSIKADDEGQEPERDLDSNNLNRGGGEIS